VFFGIFLYLFQKNIVYHPNNQDFYSCPGFQDAEKITLKDTRFYYKQNSKKLLIYYHGNAGSACDRHFIKDRFEKLGYSYIFVEYTGYSADSKKPSKPLLLKDVENVNNFIKDIEYDELILVGSSLGSAFASYHSTLTSVDKIILISAFDSLLNVAKALYPFYPIKYMLKENYDNYEWLNGFSGKLLLLHPEKDTVVNIKHGERFFKRLEFSKKKFVRLKGVGHNDLFLNNMFWKEVTLFLKK